jgi:hypothetical protein
MRHNCHRRLFLCTTISALAWHILGRLAGKLYFLGTALAPTVSGSQTSTELRMKTVPLTTLQRIQWLASIVEDTTTIGARFRRPGRPGSVNEVASSLANGSETDGRPATTSLALVRGRFVLGCTAKLVAEYNIRRIALSLFVSAPALHDTVGAYRACM